jgi:restriction system protein
MGYAKDELATTDQLVKGVIIGHEDDPRIHRALSMTQNIEFYTYKVRFELEKQR